MSDHKYENKSGYPTFWNHILDAIDFQRDNLSRPEYTNCHEDPTLKNKQPIQRMICTNCDSNVGFVYDDGPGPFFKRFQVNSCAISFEPKPWFRIPEFTKEELSDIKKQR